MTAFSARTRVGFSDTDAQGVVYYGRYFPYFDLARTEYLRHVGRVDTPGCEFVLRAQTVEYHAPARFDDLLEVFVRVARVGTSSLTWELAAYKLNGEDDTVMTTASQTQVLIDRASRTPQPIPEPFRGSIASVEP